MLGATPTKDHEKYLEIIKLVLGLVSDREQNIPESLKSHIITVIQQAKQLRHDPRSLSVRVFPESIELALELQQDGIFRELDHVNDFDNITPDLANRLLRQMEHRPASQD